MTILSLIGNSLVIKPDLINSYTATIMIVSLKYVERLGESGAAATKLEILSISYIAIKIIVLQNKVEKKIFEY